jgi:hypothetical protein
MDEKRLIIKELDEIQHQLKELEIRYEQYFAGIERREPYNERKDLARRLRQYTNRHIVWTDLKFRHQSLASRFMTYGQYWDRILRLIDEGKYHRHTTKIQPPSKPAPATAARSPKEEATRLQKELSAARESLGLRGDAPSTDSVEVFLAAQREKIRNRYGDKPVQFSVDTSGGKPRIKVSLKK